MIAPDDHFEHKREVLITLDEIHTLYNLLADEYEAYPPSPFYDTARAYDKDLAMRLMNVWLYWAKRTHDPTRFVLKIKR